MKKRCEIEEKYKWDLTPLCKDDKDFYDKIEKLKAYIPKFQSFKEKLNNKQILKEYFALNREFLQEFYPVYLYAYIKSQQKAPHSSPSKFLKSR